MVQYKAQNLKCFFSIRLDGVVLVFRKAEHLLRLRYFRFMWLGFLGG